MPLWELSKRARKSWKEFKGAPALDAGLLAAAQAVEHYEIARYGTLKTWARNSLKPGCPASGKHAFRRKRRRTKPLPKLRKAKSISTRKLLEVQSLEA